ncbi:MAG: hypothetical protein NTX33_19450 [Propionibacteriales bacterium]|nr:hypothetical protein [Propionibacteriales bacterium]
MLNAEDDRAKSTSGLFVAGRNRFLPEPEPFGRVIEPPGNAIVPPPVAAYVATLNAGAGNAPFHACANDHTAC